MADISDSKRVAGGEHAASSTPDDTPDEGGGSSPPTKRPRTDGEGAAGASPRGRGTEDQTPPPPAWKGPRTIVTFNVNGGIPRMTKDWHEIDAFVTKEAPDLIVFQEVCRSRPSSRWGGRGDGGVLGRVEVVSRLRPFGRSLRAFCLAKFQKSHTTYWENALIFVSASFRHWGEPLIMFDAKWLILCRVPFEALSRGAPGCCVCPTDCFHKHTEVFVYFSKTVFALVVVVADTLAREGSAQVQDDR